MTIVTGLKVDVGTGAGSRGGKVIGTTKSGKPIYEDHKHPSHEKFHYFEHKQAAELHDELGDKARNAKQVLVGHGGTDPENDAVMRQHHESYKHHMAEHDFKERKKNWSPKELKAAGLTKVGGRAK